MIDQQTMFETQTSLIKIKSQELEKQINEFEMDKHKFESERKEHHEVKIKNEKLKDELKCIVGNEGGDVMMSPYVKRKIRQRYNTAVMSPKLNHLSRSLILSKETSSDLLIDEEILNLHEELTKAQNMMQTANSENDDALKMKIYRIKTQLSNLRSTKALNNSQVRPVSIRNAVVDHNDVKRLTSNGRKSLFALQENSSPLPKRSSLGPKQHTPTPEKISPFSELKTPRKINKPPINGSSTSKSALKNQEKTEQETESLKKYLKVQEAKLIEKEKELTDKEIMLQQT